MARQVFFSFQYNTDAWRASQIRNIGVIEGNKAAYDNDWETIKRGGDAAIKRWIDEQMKYRSCTVVLIGETTASRKWINYEIEQSWRNKMGVVGIRIHRLKDRFGNQSNQGNNPFSNISIEGVKIENFIKVYNSPYSDSKDVYNYISNNILAWVNEAIVIRSKYL